MKQIHLRADAVASSSGVDTVERINTANKIIVVLSVVITDRVATSVPVVVRDGVVMVNSVVAVDGVGMMDELTPCSACMWNRHSR